MSEKSYADYKKEYAEKDFGSLYDRIRRQMCACSECLEWLRQDDMNRRLSEGFVEGSYE